MKWQIRRSGDCLAHCSPGFANYGVELLNHSGASAQPIDVVTRRQCLVACFVNEHDQAIGRDDKLRHKALSESISRIHKSCCAGTTGFAIGVRLAYIRVTPRKPIELPADVVRTFVEDMRAFLPSRTRIRRDEIAARQLHALRQDHTGKLRLSDVHEMFVQMKDYA